MPQARSDREIFRQASTTYYWSSMFFPPAVRDDVFKLYSFVRIADDYVDAVPQDKRGFKRFEELWRRALQGNPSKGHSEAARAVRNMLEVATAYDFDSDWTEDFLTAMRADLRPKRYRTLEDTIAYMHGSAEVIGLMMAKIMGLPETAYSAAKMQGRAMQYINFLRDIDEDLTLGRRYLPESELERYGLARLDRRTAYKHPAAFREFIEAQVEYYRRWQAEAAEGFRYIPFSQRIALRTAVDMYNWTADQILRDPFIVFEKKVKPSKVRVIGRAVRRIFSA